MKIVKVMKVQFENPVRTWFRENDLEFQTLERASGMMLSFPFMCLMSRLNSWSNKLHLSNLWFLFLSLCRKLKGLWSLNTTIGEVKEVK